ncbi:MAG: hypothetical protein M0P17_06015 [Methanoculleus sp.]|jgi:hypothetical protein|nr:hypothetical protein [Methanoculleus sp.]
MNTKIGMQAFPLLLAVMLVSAGVMPLASATENEGAGIDLDRYSPPQLNVDPSIETIAISEALSPQPERRITDGRTEGGIPFGSIVVHAADGITRVFDRDGNQLLSISDEKSGKLPTPAGIEKSCTRLHQLPNDSRVYHRGDQTFVLDAAGELILTVIDEAPPSSRNVAMLRGWTGHSWVESAEDEPNSEITEYTAYWTVPSSPPSLESDEIIYLFNGIEGTVEIEETGESKTYLLQPVLAYNGSTHQWQGQAWAACSIRQDSYYGPLFDTATGHTMRGRIYWSSSLNLWSITIYDHTTGQYSSLSTQCMQPEPGYRVGCVLEAWHIDDNTDVPGDALFYDMEYKSYGTPMSIDLEPWYSTEVPYEIMQYCWVEIIQDPSRVRLHTYN